MKAGSSYIIVCSLENPSLRNDFHLSVYFNDIMRNVTCKRVFHPEDKNNGKEQVLPTFIPEESEKCFKNTPLWKIQLVKESLKFMMTDEDEDIDF